jgi:hypothetical protein
MACFRAAGLWVNATEPPKGLASAEFRSLATQTLVAPLEVPEQVIPANIWIVTGKLVVVTAERPPKPRPGTFCITAADLKAAGSVPPEVRSIVAVRGRHPG